MIQRLNDKQPHEKWYIDFDFSRGLDSPSSPNSGEHIDNIQKVQIVDRTTEEDVTDSMNEEVNNVMSEQHAYIWVAGGEDKHYYQITCRIKGAASGRVLENDGLLRVREL